MPSLELMDAARRMPDKPALRDASSTYTYGDLLRGAAGVADRLRSRANDLRESRVAMLVSPGFHYVAAQWGIWQAGGVVVPLGLMHPPPELEYVIDDAGVDGVVVEEALRDRVEGIASARGMPVVTTGERVSAGEGVPPPPRVPAQRRAMILYTSGSTGRPKGVVTTHAQVLAQIDSLVRAWGWNEADHILHVLPLHHIHGIVNVLGCAMRVGALCEFQFPFDAARVWQRFAEGGLTLFMAVPTIYARLIAAHEQADEQQKRQWSDGARRLRLMVSGSAALPVAMLETWERLTGQRLLERYGMTEIGMALSNPLEGERRAGYVGGPLPGVEVRRRLNGQAVDDATPAEIEVRGPNVFLEYWDRPEATRSSFAEDGWFRTGDIAVVDRGAYRILGRQSVDIIKTGGYKVSALEIEDVLREHPEIADCAVVGVADEEWGERVAVCVVSQGTGPGTLDALRGWCKERLASYKVPTRMCIRPELPRNAMGKVQKPLVRRFFADEGP